MTYFLDSNTIIFALRNKSAEIKDKVRSVSRGKVKVPAMVMAELLVGAHKSQNARQNLDIVFRFLEPYEIVPFDADASETYGIMGAELEKEGNMIGPNDLIIAATVLSRGGVLVTNNTKEFDRVKGLCIEDWSK